MEEPVPLSEHEQKLLEQIEQALYAEDPKFARSWRVKDLRSLQPMRVLRAAAIVLLGLGLLVAGVVVQSRSIVVGVALGVGGFLFMLLGAWFAMSTRARRAAPRQPKKKVRVPKESLKARLEERWQRRQEGR
jgi:protein-S-isoprenylcysteine O-methyltransferase Ste14